MKKKDPLSSAVKRKAWSMLNNLNGEAEYYKDDKGRFNNTDEAIANRLGADVVTIRGYLTKRVEAHLNRINNKQNHES